MLAQETFTFERSISASSIAGIASGDFNGDGVIDLVSGTAVSLAITEQKASVEKFYLLTQEGARNALANLDEQLNRITTALGSLGADSSRLNIATKTLSVASENFAAARSQIIDADIASESAKNIRYSILLNATSAVLAQANQQPALALSLIG